MSEPTWSLEEAFHSNPATNKPVSNIPDTFSQGKLPSRALIHLFVHRYVSRFFIVIFWNIYYKSEKISFSLSRGTREVTNLFFHMMFSYLSGSLWEEGGWEKKREGKV